MADGSTHSLHSPATLARRQRQQRAIVQLAAGNTVAAAARAAGVARWTIYDWLRHQPEFRAALVEAAGVQGAIVQKGLDAIAFAAETSVTQVFHKVHTRKKHIWALNRVLDLYEGMEDRLEQRLRYAERFSASHTTSSAKPEPETQPIVDEPTESEADPNRRVA